MPLHGCLVGLADDLLFDGVISQWGETRVHVRVYSGEVEYVFLTKQHVIDLVDHLTELYNLDGESDAEASMVGPVPIP